MFATEWSPIIVGIAILALVGYLVELGRQQQVESGFPTAEVDVNDWHGSLMRAKTKFGNDLYYFGTHDKTLILPHHLLEELKNLPDSEISFQDQVANLLLGQFSGIAMHDLQPLIKTLNHDVTRNLQAVLASLQEEVGFAVGKEIGQCKNWTPIPVLHTLQRVVACSTAQLFVGPSLCRDADWLEITLGFTKAVTKAVLDIQGMPKAIRPFAMLLSAPARHILYYRRRCHLKIRPTLDAMTLAVTNSGGEKSGGANELRLPYWLLKHGEMLGKKHDVDLLEDNILAASFAAIHTTSFTLTNVLFDLASHSKVADVLRSEIMQVLEQSEEGRITKSEMPKLRQLDSAINESLRIHPMSSAATQRVVTAQGGITLSTGQFLPKGTRLAFGQAIQTSAGSAEYLQQRPQQPSLDEYSPFRFSDLRAQEGQANKHQLVSANIENTVFGYGRHACPGRFFASNEIKTILIEILMRYDFALAPSSNGSGEPSLRPSTRAQFLGYYPDENAVVCFRERIAH